MEGFVDFKSAEYTLPTYMRFSVTTKAFEDMSYHSKGAQGLLSDLSMAEILLISKGSRDDIYDVFTSDGNFSCRITNDFDAFLIIAFQENNLIIQNRAMKDSTSFKVEPKRPVIVKLTIAGYYNIFKSISRGREYDTNRFDNKRVKDSLTFIKDTLAKIEGPPREDEDREYKPHRRLTNLLQLAENYAILSSELEEMKAKSTGSLSYYTIAALDYDRVDRVAYKFLVDEVDENIFKAGGKVDVEDRQGVLFSGEILALGQDGGFGFIDILFNDQINIEEFNQIGWIALSFSDVNKEVQLGAIEKIREGNSKASYMNAVIGERKPQGFYDRDLEGLKADLSKQEYPPNQSQMKGIISGINSKDALLVMGPPGTGKTTVIVEWVKYFVKQEGKRVLISSQNNKAVDNVLAKLIEEKDIDLIRIGSESKLQAEIKPYMFENKIRELREDIGRGTSKNITAIEAISGEWVNFLERLKYLLSMNEDIDILSKTYENLINKEILTRYKKLLNLNRRYDFLGQETGVIQDKLLKNIDKTDKYEKENKTYKKALLWLPNFLRSSMIKMRVKKLDKLKTEEADLVNRYNKTYREYENIYKNTLENEFTSFYKKDINRDSIILEISKALPDNKNKWDLFSLIRIEDDDWRNSKKLSTINNTLGNEISRANEIIGTVGAWKKEIESTQNYALNEIVLESVNVVGATCIGINSQKRFADLDFDITIIDEAGQIQVHNALVPMSVSDKLIMLGDHKQIPPMADQELMELCQQNDIDTELLEISLFERMYEELPDENKIMLDTQYRMPGDIADIISDWFYDGGYKSADFKRNVASMITKLSSKPLVIIDTSRESERFERRIPNAGYKNNLEANIVKDLIKYLSLDRETDFNEVGVISAYKSQVKLIKEKVETILPEEVVNEMVATLDSFQGQERDIIIYSFTRSSKKNPKNIRIGFLNELRRLNVALSRCKKTLVLIGDMDFLAGCQYMEIDEYGETVYEKSEKEFSDFINKMLEDVKRGRGDLINYEEFLNRLSKGSVSIDD